MATKVPPGKEFVETQFLATTASDYVSIMATKLPPGNEFVETQIPQQPPAIVSPQSQLHFSLLLFMPLKVTSTPLITPTILYSVSSLSFTT